MITRVIRTGFQWPAFFVRAIVIFTICHFPAHAQTGFELKPAREGLIIGTGLLFQGSALLLEHRIKDLPPPNLDLSRVPGIDRIAVRQWHLAAHRASNVLFGVAVAASLATAIVGDDNAKPLVPIVIIAESGLLASGVTNTVKAWAHRPRPYLYNANAPDHPVPTTDDQLSFWSGHTANTAALTFACANMVQHSDASRGLKTVTWIGAAITPAAMGYLRVRSGRHFPTDVLTGYAVGALIGWAVPYFHRVK